MKSKELLDQFTHFCEVNPHLRFWQALSAWSGLQIWTPDGDTFYWEGKNK